MAECNVGFMIIGQLTGGFLVLALVAGAILEVIERVRR